MSSLLLNIPPPPFRGQDGMTTFDLGPLSVAAYGVLIAVGAYLGLRLLVSRYEEAGGDPDIAEKTALLAIGAGIVGARIGYVIPRTDRFLANPAEIPQIWTGGLAFFGGVALASVLCLLYVRRRKGDLAAMADAAAPALPLAQAIGRWGNYFNQELYGRPTELPWALQIEPQRRVEGFEDAETFHPTFLYESLWNLALVAFLLWADRRRVDGRRWLRRGSLGFVYLIGYGVGRFGTELLRIDTVERYLGLSRNSWVALAVIIIGIVGVVWWERRGEAEPVDGAAADEPDDEAADEPDGDAPTDPPDDEAPTDPPDDEPDGDAPRGRAADEDPPG